MRQVHVFIIQKPIDNHNSLKILRREFGENIPQFNPLEGGDYNGSQYLCCIDRSIDYEFICEKYDYRYYPAYKFEVEKSKYNDTYEIRHNYFNKNEPYKLEKYVASQYYDSDEESK